MLDKNKILDLFSLEGKVAIVTGGAGRLGLQHIDILHKAGAQVVSFDVNKNAAIPASVEQYIVDITKPQKVKKIVDEIAEKYGSIHILINNAAINPKVGKDSSDLDKKMFSPYEDYPQELWERELAVGLSGAHFCIQAVAPYLMKQKEGSVINVASTSAITAPQHGKYEKGKYKSVAYPTVKTALLGLTRAWASYFAATSPGIRVNSVSFGAVNFGSMEPEFLAKLGSRNMLGRPARPDEYQGIILFLASKASEFITASNLVADAGQTAW
jgi:NAD(P)-dependent dehydrogenase (short-subunit alcohol dehydrogenase family)